MEENKAQVFSSSSGETVANIEDLLTEILLRVPSKKTLTRFKCVSKHGLSLISSPSFCISHTTRYKSLYICTYYDHLLEDALPHGYRVHAIKLSDLFSLISNAASKPITLYPLFDDSKSKSELDSHVLRQVTHMCGDNDNSELPFGMGCGVLGSRIVLPDGCFEAADDSYYEPRPSYALDITESEPKFDPSVIPALTGYPYELLQINGKLYALCDDIFAVYDPNFPTTGWTPLPKIPLWNWSHYFLCSVVESKIIIASFPGGRTERFAEPRRFCYDVAAPNGSWTQIIAPLLGYEGKTRVVIEPLWYVPGKALVVASEDDYFDKLMFVVHREHILVFGIHLSEEAGVPTGYELVAKINLPEFSGSFDSYYVKSSSGAYLGDGRFCFAFLYVSKISKSVGRVTRVPRLLVFTFDFTYMRFPPHDISNSSTSDPSIRCTSFTGSFSAKTPGYYLRIPPHDSSTSDPSIRCTSFIGSFSAKTPGYYLFEFNYAEKSLPIPDTLLCGCFVL